jgi:hypothetical protein
MLILSLYLIFVNMRLRYLSLLLFFVCGSIILAGCGAKDASGQPAAKPVATEPIEILNNDDTMNKRIMNFQVTGYAQDGIIPVKFATKGGGGENVSIGVKWTPLPAAKSYALLFDDKHPIANNWVHWLVVDIPNTANEITVGASRTEKMPQGSRELMTSWERTGYDGPQPPKGSGNHEYVAHLFALDTEKLDAAENVTRKEFLQAIEGHTILSETYGGFFERK